MLHNCMTHGILLFVGHPTYVKSSQNKEINYKVIESKLSSFNYKGNLTSRNTFVFFFLSLVTYVFSSIVTS
jgi:hypothetical protein